MDKIAICINVRDRPTELAMCMLSLKNQTFQNWDLWICDDMSGTPLNNYHFFNCMITNLKNDGHDIHIIRTEFPHGVSMARQKIVDEAMKDKSWNLYLRIDDDIVLESDFIEKLIEGIKQGYNLMSGVTPSMVFSSFVRNPEMLKVVNRVVLNKGEIIMNMDDCGMLYTDDAILPAHHFRSSLMAERIIFEKIKYWPTRLSKHGFREEQLFSFNAIINGFKIGNHMNAVAHHQCTPSGGERFMDQGELIKFNETILKEETKKMFEKHGDFISEYNKKLGLELTEPDEEELAKDTNLIMK